MVEFYLFGWIMKRDTKMNEIWLFGDYSQAEVRVAAWAGPVPSMKTWFERGEDVHLNVAKLIGQTVEKHKIKLPRGLWARKPWQELNKHDQMDHDNERDLAKRTVHANTNGMGPVQFGVITGLPVRYANIVQEVYHSIFPEIHANYHAWIIEQLRSTRTLTNPLGWKRTFYDIYGPALEREAFAWYPQSTIGLLTIRTFRLVCELFKSDIPEAKIQTPSRIREMGLDVQLQVHDAIGVVLPNDPTLVRDTVKAIRSIAEYPLLIKGETLIVPMDFKTGPSWGELKDYELS